MSYSAQPSRGGSLAARGPVGSRPPAPTLTPFDAHVHASIQRDKAVVVPTMSSSMMDEFNERMRKITLNPTVSKNPFDEQGGVGQRKEPDTHAPTPPFEQYTTYNQQHYTYDLATGGPFDSYPREFVPAGAEPGRDPFSEDLHLVGLITGYLRRRQEDGRGASDLSDLYSQIKALTGKDWAVYWRPLHGDLIDFVSRHPDAMTLISDKVVPAGFEYLAYADLDPNLHPSSESYTTPEAMAPFYQSHHPEQYHHVTYHAEPPSSYYPPPPPPPTSTNPFLDSYQSLQQQYPNVPLPHAVAPYYTNDDDWVLFEKGSNATAALNPFDSYGIAAPLNDADPLAAFANPDEARRKEEKKQRKAEEKKKKQQELDDAALAMALQQEENEVARTSSSSAPASAWATRAPPSVAPPTPSLPTSAGQDQTCFEFRNDTSGELNKPVALTHVELRELAEAEVGKDNIRILAGFSVIKFGREGRPHQRKMWINSALTHLAWESAQFDGSHRGLELGKVTALRIGEMTPTIKRSTNKIKRVQFMCFSLETNVRTLDLQACSVIQRDALAAALKKVIEFNHRHKPCRIDKYRTQVLM